MQIKKVLVYLHKYRLTHGGCRLFFTGLLRSCLKAEALPVIHQTPRIPGAEGHLQHRVRSVGGTAGMVVAVAGKSISQRAALLSQTFSPAVSKKRDAWHYLITSLRKREGRKGKT